MKKKIFLTFGMTAIVAVATFNMFVDNSKGNDLLIQNVEVLAMGDDQGGGTTLPPGTIQENGTCIWTEYFYTNGNPPQLAYSKRWKGEAMSCIQGGSIMCAPYCTKDELLPQ